MAQHSLLHLYNSTLTFGSRAGGRSAGMGESCRKYPASEFLIPPPVEYGLPLEALLSEEDFPSDPEVDID